jgi:diguanylate cyclase (GGDEF)-like protein
MLKILIADDSPTIRAGLSRLVEKMGYRVIQAVDGAEALALYESERPDLVLIDVMMPVMDGYEAARRMRAGRPDEWSPIIFLSSMEADQDLDRAIAAGGDDYLVKPVSFVVLNAKIRAMHRIETMRRKLLDVSSQLAVANRELELLSRQDALTRIANRRHFDTYLNEEMKRAARQKSDLSLVLIDIDHFKRYNDRYGHPQGDACLKAVAAALAATCRRPADLVARYGGEEFAIVLPDTPLSGAVELAEASRQAVKSLALAHADSDVAPVVTLSEGVAVLVPDQHATADHLIECADRCLYQAKQNGRDRVVAHDGALTGKAA